jgi:hypothetical protein
MRAILPAPVFACVGWAVLAAAATGCGAKRVPNDVLEKLPYESRIELLEAENELALAVDHLDEAHNEVSRTRDAIQRAKDRRSSAKNEVGDAKDPQSREVAQLAVEEADARVEYLRARQRVNVANEDVQDVELGCARERFELARVTVARKAKVRGSEGLNPERFEKQVKSCEADVASDRKKLKQKVQEAEAARSDWEKRKTVLARKTFDARASPYVE